MLVQKALLDHQLLLTCLVDRQGFDIRTVSTHEQASRLHASGSNKVPPWFILSWDSLLCRALKTHLPSLTGANTGLVEGHEAHRLCRHRASAHTTAPALDSSLPCSPHQHLVPHPAHGRGSMKTPYSDSPPSRSNPSLWALQVPGTSASLMSPRLG